jgi:hypothetical protein
MQMHARRTSFRSRRVVVSAGWVCYAEKTHGEWILPYLSTAKSPQAVAGTLIKGNLARNDSEPTLGAAKNNTQHTAPEHSITQGQCCAQEDTAAEHAACSRNGSQMQRESTPANRNAPTRSVYHVAIMPCYDKKLEAARSDFTVAGHSSRGNVGQGGATGEGEAGGEEFLPETDCVLTTGELQELLQEKGVELGDVHREPFDDWEQASLQLGGCSGAVRRGQKGAPIHHVNGADAAPAGKVCCGVRAQGGPAGAFQCGSTAEGDSAAEAPADSPMSCVETATGVEPQNSGVCEAGCEGGGDESVAEVVSGVRGGSGGYLEYAVKNAALELFGLVRLVYFALF